MRKDLGVILSRPVSDGLVAATSDAAGVWSSHRYKSPGQANSEAFTEVLCVLKWDERAAKAFRLALRGYNAAGRPGIPLGARDYRKAFGSSAASPAGVHVQVPGKTTNG